MTKKYEEYLDSDDVLSSGIHPLLDKRIRELMDPMMIGAQLLGRDNSLINAPGRAKTFRREATRMIAQDFNEGDDVPDISVADPDEYFDKEPTYFGGSDPITNEAIMDADYNAVNRSLNRIARAMAIKSDSRIWNEMLDATETTEVFAINAGESDLAHGQTSDPGTVLLDVHVYETGTLTPYTGSVWQVDYEKGHIDFDGAGTGPTVAVDVVYNWSELGTRGYVTASTPGEISYEDMVNSKVSLRSEFVDGDTIVLDKLAEGQILKDEKFIDASHFGEKTMIKGQIGKIAGMDVLTTDTLFDQMCIVLKRGAELGVVLYKEKTKTEVEKMEGKAGDVRAKAWQKSTPVVIRPEWIRLVINGQPRAYVA